MYTLTLNANDADSVGKWTRFWISCTVRAPVLGRHQFFGTSEHYGKAHGSLLSGWMNYDYTACCWFPTSNNILTLPSQFWQIGALFYKGLRLIVWWISIVAQIVYNLRLIATLSETGPRFESYWSHCSKCRILVLLRYTAVHADLFACLFNPRYGHSVKRRVGKGLGGIDVNL